MVTTADFAVFQQQLRQEMTDVVQQLRTEMNDTVNGRMGMLNSINTALQNVSTIMYVGFRSVPDSLSLSRLPRPLLLPLSSLPARVLCFPFDSAFVFSLAFPSPSVFLSSSLCSHIQFHSVLPPSSSCTLTISIALLPLIFLSRFVFFSPVAVPVLSFPLLLFSSSLKRSLPLLVRRSFHTSSHLSFRSLSFLLSSSLLFSSLLFSSLLFSSLLFPSLLFSSLLFSLSTSL